ncbi:hypothetical protein Plhal304r1_c059g0147491 [Plasmopara halstedii]
MIAHSKSSAAELLRFSQGKILIQSVSVTRRDDIVYFIQQQDRESLRRRSTWLLSPYLMSDVQ